MSLRGRGRRRWCRRTRWSRCGRWRWRRRGRGCRRGGGRVHLHAIGELAPLFLRQLPYFPYDLVLLRIVPPFGCGAIQHVSRAKGNVAGDDYAGQVHCACVVARDGVGNHVSQCHCCGGVVLQKQAQTRSRRWGGRGGWGRRRQDIVPDRVDELAIRASSP